MILQACSTKRKQRSLIPVQPTAKSRRLYKMRGSRAAVQGRPRSAQRLAVQLTVGDGDGTDDGVLRHKLPTKKKRAKGSSAHDLMGAVSANRRASKKH